MHPSKLARWCAIGASLTLLAAACGSDDETTADTAADAVAETTAAADTTAAAEPTDTAATGDTASGDTAAPAGGDDLDATFGVGATAFKAAIEATADAPLVAEGDPFVISMPNLEGDAGGSFPDVREGAEAAVQFVNERLGGIGADYEAGTPGRPIQLNVCSHGLTPEAAQGCANEVAGDEPNLVAVGIDFFSPVMFPVFEQYPIMQMLPIFVSDYLQAGSYSAIGGCPTAFFGAVNYMATAGFDKIAFMYSDNAPGQGCWTDTTERPLQHFKDQGTISDFKGFANLPGDPSDDAPQYQEIASFLEGAENPAVFFSVQSTDCVEYIKGLRSLGVDAQLVAGSACVDDTVKGLPEAEGIIVEFQSYNPDGDLGEFERLDVDARAAAIADFGPDSAVSTFMEDAFGTIVWSWQIANYMIEQGDDPWDSAAYAETLSTLPAFHFVGRPSVDCSSNPEEYPAICFRKSTWLQWDGSAFNPEDALNGEYADLTELMGEVAASNPRPAG
jgi:branched-chain amino acid transport system substrate-binding protein